jgi:hypothetical protein
VFVTTSDFSRAAIEYVARVQYRVRLINGPTLADLLIQHGVGVRERVSYFIKSVDEDYFAGVDRGHQTAVTAVNSGPAHLCRHVRQEVPRIPPRRRPGSATALPSGWGFVSLTRSGQAKRNARRDDHGCGPSR